MSSKENLAGRACSLIAIAAVIPVIPMLFLGNPWGHDFDLHVPLWMEAEQQFRAGIVYPRWVSAAYSGFGGPLFIFYPPLPWMTGALLGLVLPWKMVPGVYVWLVLVVAGMAMWKCASDWLDRDDAVMAGLLYAANPYLLLTAYKRCNYAELPAIALFPLLVWAAVRIGRDTGKGILPLSLAFAVIWLTDLPAAVVASYSLASLLLLNSLFHRSLRPALRGAVAILAGFGSIAVFLLPAAWERKWVNIDIALAPEWVPEHNFLFTRDNIPQYVSFNRGVSFIALFLVIVAAIAALLARRLRRDTPDVWGSLVTLGGLSTFMMVPPSLILYRILPELRYVGFPWRWLTPLCAATAFLTAAAVGQAQRKRTLWVAVAIVAGGIGAQILSTTWWNPEHLTALTKAMHSGLQHNGAPWTSPLGSQPTNLPKAAPLVAPASTESEKGFQPIPIDVELWSPERKLFSLDAPRPLKLEVKLLTYPAWQATVNGQSVSLETDHETGQMLLPVPAGFSRAEIEFKRTWDRTIGIAVSAIVASTLGLLMLRRRRETAVRSEPDLR